MTRTLKFFAYFGRVMDENAVSLAILAQVGMLMMIYAATAPYREIFDPLYSLMAVMVSMPIVFSMIGIITQAVALALLPDDDAEMEMERQFVAACQPAIDALPEERREEYLQRLIDGCEYYNGPRKSIRQKLDEWLLRTNLRGE